MFQKSIAQIQELLTTPIWYSYLLRIIVFFAIAWIVQRLSRFLANRFFSSARTPIDMNRRKTLQGLIASMISLFAYLVAALFSAGQFISPDTLLWLVGLFSAAFAFSVRPIVSDWLTGLTLIFDDTFRVGDKVVLSEVEGVVEKVCLRNTQIRSPLGELFIVPNGEIRIVRNFSRSDYSIVKVTVNVRPSDSGRAADLLDGFSAEAVARLSDLIEPWQVLGDDEDGSKLIIVAKAKYGHAAEMRPRMLELAHDFLTDNKITFSNANNS